MEAMTTPRHSTAYRQFERRGALDASHAAGEVRRYLRFARLAKAGHAGQLIAEAKFHARHAWRVALELEARGA